MRAVFMGTPTFAVPALQMLLDGSYEVCCVFTQPDRPSGRGQRMQPSPVKSLAVERGVPVFQPDKIREEDCRPILERFCPDFIAVVAYGQILPGWLLKTARVAAINTHASLLPRYRGAAPIPRAILNGDSVTGITTMIVVEALDSGPILLQKEVPIPLEMTAGQLSEVLSKVAANLLIQTMDGLSNNAILPIPQAEHLVSWAPRITKEMAPICWEKRALEIHNQIRAMNPWPVACSDFRGEKLLLWRSLPADPAGARAALPGTCVGISHDGICVQCGEGTVLNLLEVQKPAKGKISGREFANGARLRAGEPIFRDSSAREIPNPASQ
jgi:methionyl-tRNA formyltransferase